MPEKNSILHTHVPKIHLVSIAALVISVFSMLLAVLAVQSLNMLIRSYAKSRKTIEDPSKVQMVNMTGGDIVTLNCSGKNLLTQRKGGTSLTAWCSELPNTAKKYPTIPPDLQPSVIPGTPSPDLTVEPTEEPFVGEPTATEIPVQESVAPTEDPALQY